MNLHQSLNQIREKFENGDTPPEIIEILNSHVEHLLASNVGELAISIGETAPLDLEIPFQQSNVSMRQFLNSRFLVLTWFRGNW